MIPYNFTDAGRGYINIVKSDGNPDTKFVLYTDRDNGYGMYTSDYGVDDDEWQLHRLAQPATPGILQRGRWPVLSPEHGHGSGSGQERPGPG